MCWNITKSCNPNKGTTSKGWREILDINNGSVEVQSGAMALDKAAKQLLASPSTMMWVHASALAKWTAQRMAVASACIDKLGRHLLGERESQLAKDEDKDEQQGKDEDQQVEHE